MCEKPFFRKGWLEAIKGVTKNVYVMKAKADFLHERNGTIAAHRSGLLIPVEIEGFRGGDLFRLYDDGMSPGYAMGDVVVCTRRGSVADLASGKLLVLRIDDEYFLKRVLLIDEHILLDSDNKKYSLSKIREKEIDAIWEVESKLTPALLNRVSGADVSYLERDLESIKEQLEKLEGQLRKTEPYDTGEQGQWKY